MTARFGKGSSNLSDNGERGGRCSDGAVEPSLLSKSGCDPNHSLLSTLNYKPSTPPNQNSSGKAQPSDCISQDASKSGGGPSNEGGSSSQSLQPHPFNVLIAEF
jgi:hypothetical protein